MRGIYDLSKTNPEVGRYGKCKKRYEEKPRGKSPPTCLIHGISHSSEKYKVLSSSEKKHLGSKPKKESKYEYSRRKQEVNYMLLKASDQVLKKNIYKK